MEEIEEMEREIKKLKLDETTINALVDAVISTLFSEIAELQKKSGLKKEVFVVQYDPLRKELVDTFKANIRALRTFWVVPGNDQKCP